MSKKAPAPYPAYRLIPSQYPPISLFDTVTTAADMKAAFDVVGWSSDRLVQARINRLDQADWVYGIPNSSIVMAAYLHVSPDGMRFNSSNLGAWYAGNSINTAIAEVAHHLRRECFADDLDELARVYRAYSCEIVGQYVDIRGRHVASPELYDGRNYAMSQAFGEGKRAAEDGILYDSLRHSGGENVCVFRPKRISNVTQTQHIEISVERKSPDIRVKRL